jgi:hypothetical protein
MPPPFVRTFRSRAAIERALIEGIRAIVELHDFDRENRTASAIAEISLVTHLNAELMLDVRDLLMECAVRLSELVPPEFQPRESDPAEGDS